MSATEQWAILRHVVIGTSDLGAASSFVRDVFGLAPGLEDPLLEQMGLADETFPVGPQAHLEVVAPIREKNSIHDWLDKVGGASGYCLSIQVPNLEPHLAALQSARVRVAIQTEAYGRRIIQIHPGDMGLLIELDEIPNPQEWFWDDLNPVKSENPFIDEILGVVVTAPDPAASAQLWANVLCTTVENIDGRPGIRLGSRTVRFAEGGSRRLSEIAVSATPAGAHLPAELAYQQLTFRVTHPSSE